MATSLQASARRGLLCPVVETRNPIKRWLLKPSRVRKALNAMLKAEAAVQR